MSDINYGKVGIRIETNIQNQKSNDYGTYMRTEIRTLIEKDNNWKFQFFIMVIQNKDSS